MVMCIFLQIRRNILKQAATPSQEVGKNSKKPTKRGKSIEKYAVTG